MARNEQPAVENPLRPSPPGKGKGVGKRRRGLDAGGEASARDDETGIPPPSAPSASRRGEDPIRRCILSGERASRESLIRLALSPDGDVAPDVRARAPGRGAWIGVDRETLEAALKKGKLKGALARAFKTQAIVIPADLGARIETALERATLDRLGLEARSGTLLSGSDRIEDAARKGQVALLLHAADAAPDGSRRLDQALRVGSGAEGSDLAGLAIPASRAILSMALGRENVVHAALIAPAAAGRVMRDLGRWRGYIGRDWALAPRDNDVVGPIGDDSETKDERV